MEGSNPTPTLAADFKPAILLVEDEKTSRLMTARQLTRAGYDVEAVSNGTEALATLAKRFFPMLLTDWDMPGMDGVALCKAIRAMALEGYVYIVLLTARQGKAHLIEGLAAGADDYLTKPPDDNELRARLNTGLRILQLEQSLRSANRRIQLLSITDALTGTYNRHHLMERLPQEIERSRRYRHPLSVVLCDVDHFKHINDTHGHQAGDKVLKSFAQLLLGSSRGGGDWVVRYGGEEFLIVLPEAMVSSALSFADKIRAIICAHSFQIPGGALHVTASFGVAGYDPLGAPDPAIVDRLIDRADACLYRSKQAGRNQVTGEMVMSRVEPAP
jgi:two-component system, cell cycle response regulator